MILGNTNSSTERRLEILSSFHSHLLQTLKTTAIAHKSSLSGLVKLSPSFLMSASTPEIKSKSVYVDLVFKEHRNILKLTKKSEHIISSSKRLVAEPKDEPVISIGSLGKKIESSSKPILRKKENQNLDTESKLLGKRERLVSEGDIFDDARLLELVNLCKDELLELDLKHIKSLISFFGIHAFVSIYQGDQKFVADLSEMLMKDRQT